jgi:hypothetical protein
LASRLRVADDVQHRQRVPEQAAVLRQPALRRDVSASVPLPVS